jgi:hypothetical protein
MGHFAPVAHADGKYTKPWLSKPAAEAGVIMLGEFASKGVAIRGSVQFTRPYSPQSIETMAS